jgi:hypothetical protein
LARSWLWAALPGFSAFCILPSTFAWRWLWAALPGPSMLEVGCRMLDVRCSS